MSIRTKQIVIKLSEEEKEKLKKIASKVSLPVSSFLRSLGLQQGVLNEN